MNKRLMTDMADANGLQRAIRPTGFFNIKKMAADFCSVQCIMANTGSLRSLSDNSGNRAAIAVEGSKTTLHYCAHEQDYS